MTSAFPTPPTRPAGVASAGALERTASAVLPELLGVLAFAVSFRHVRHVLVANGIDEPSSWALTVGVEALALTALLEMRRRRRRSQGTGWPTCVLLVGVALTIGCNLETAQPGFWGVLVALLGPVLYLLSLSLVATRGDGRRHPAGTTTTTTTAAPRPARSADAPQAAVAPRRTGPASAHTAATPAGASPAARAAAPAFAAPPAVAPSVDGAPVLATRPADDHPPQAVDDQPRPSAARPARNVDDHGSASVRPAAPTRGRTDAADAPHLRTTAPPPRRRPAAQPKLTTRQAQLLPAIRPAAHALAARGERVTRDALRPELARRGITVPNADLGPIARALAAEPLPTPKTETA